MKSGATVLYRYDPTDIKCDFFVYCQERARVFYRFQRQRYNGTFEDMQQTAVLAALEAIKDLEDKSQVPEELIHGAIDKALKAESKKTKGYDPASIAVVRHYVDDRDNYTEDILSCVVQPIQPPKLTPQSQKDITHFMNKCRNALSGEHLDILWKVKVLGITLQEMCDEIAVKQVGKGSWKRPSVAGFQRVLDEAVAKFKTVATPAEFEILFKLRSEYGG